MSRLILSILITIILLVQGSVVLASNESNFQTYIEDWTINKELASKYLQEAEDALKTGDELTACTTQRKASQYGIKATESLIKAMELNGSLDGLEP